MKPVDTKETQGGVLLPAHAQVPDSVNIKGEAPRDGGYEIDIPAPVVARIAMQGQVEAVRHIVRELKGLLGIAELRHENKKHRVTKQQRSGLQAMCLGKIRKYVAALEKSVADVPDLEHQVTKKKDEGTGIIVP